MNADHAVALAGTSPVSPTNPDTSQVTSLPQQTAPDDGAGLLATPDVTDAMYHGLVGEVMRASCNGTEVHPAAAGLAFLSFSGAALGRKAFVQIGNSRHHPRLYTVHVGRSSTAGKGMALDLVRRIRRHIEESADSSEQPITGHYHDGGMSSREGLAYAIRDPSDAKGKNGEILDPGVADKRMWVVEEELANVLEQARREGNTLSAALRTAWDGGDIAPLTKTNHTRASSPHICIHACITPSDLTRSMQAHDLGNGFANRFLYVWAERQGLVPFPAPSPAHVIHQLASKLIRAIEFAAQVSEVTPSLEAKSLFADFYTPHRRGLGLPAQIRGLLQRHPPYAWRIALIFALLDGRNEITRDDMTAALAWLSFCRESVIRIFSNASLQVRAADAGVLAQRVIMTLQQAGGAMGREALRTALKKPAASDLDDAIAQAEAAGLIRITSKPRTGGGRPRRSYKLTS